MWNLNPDCRQPASQRPSPRSDTMAHRRGICRHGTTAAIMVTVLAGLLLGGTVFISNQVVDMRLRIAGLEDQQEFLEAGAATLQARWNAEAAPAVIKERAASLGLIVPADPPLVLVQVGPANEAKAGLVRRFLGSLGGGTDATAGSYPIVVVPDAMVTLVPRTVASKGESDR